MAKPKYPNIHAEFARYGLSFKELADSMGTTRQNVYGKMGGKTVFTQKDMKAIQNFIKVKSGIDFSLDYLFEEN